MKLEITKEKVLEAASKCSQAKETLKTLFPECFDGRSGNIKDCDVTTSTRDNKYLCIAQGFAPIGLEDKCFALSDEFNWEMKKYASRLILIPTNK
jgi:hypothetical protein